MDSSDFIRKWEKSELKESSAAQSHFNDLCELLDVEKPTDADAVGDKYCFEKGATKSTGGNGFADVWKKGCFGWEYKGPKANLDAAYTQLQRYAVALENPPLLIVSDTKTIIVRTNWTNTVSEKHEFVLSDLIDGAKRDLLRNCFTNPTALKPKRTRDELTENAADEFSALAQRLREQGYDAQTVAHFVNRLVFCMFAEDVNLLPNKMFQRAMEHAKQQPDKATEFLTTLFGAMVKGGPVGFESVPYFNGGLFEDDKALTLDRDDIDLVLNAARMNWADIDPSVLGTLFERGLDPSKRSQLGAHYTDRDKIMMILRPVIIEPLEAKWSNILPKLENHLANEIKLRKQASKTRAAAKSGALTRKANDAKKAAGKLHSDYIEHLARFRVLDPACGSGNFLYLSLKALKDIEHKANIEAEALGLPRGFPRVGPENVLGIEINPYAAELARVSIWIGEIQWMRENGFDASRNPILKPLNNIECRDALLNKDGSETDWPTSDVIVGNPPFLGAKRMKRSLGVEETDRIRNAFKGRLPGFTNLVCYWFEKAYTQIISGNAKLTGLVATNSIAKNTNLPVMKRICESLEIFEAYADEPWVVDGAAVRVAIVAFGPKERPDIVKKLDGMSVAQINANLTSGLDTTSAKALEQNKGVGFVGIQKSGPFDIPGELAREWLQLPLNPHGKPNSNVLRPTSNGSDMVSRRRDMWLIDFPRELTESEASLWQAPFEYLLNARDEDGRSLKQLREQHDNQSAIERWWEHWRTRPEMRSAVAKLRRYIVTPMTSEYRLFKYFELPLLVDNNTIVIARDDDTSFGIVQSSTHEVWSTQMGNRMGVGNQRRYNPATIFESFPFPKGLTPDIPAADYAEDDRAQAIAKAASHLNELRENWLNPPDLLERVAEVVPGYLDRLLPVNDKAVKTLKNRTLTNLYNERPTWLEHAHRDLDRAVAAAYGWEDDFDKGRLTDDEIMKRLFELNQIRSQTL